MIRVRVLDLFSGLGGFSQGFRARGHDVYTVDVDPKFEPDLVADINLLTPLELKGEWDVILASPPCEHFSVASVYRHWPRGKPTQETAMAIGLVANALRLILQLKPRFWILENPRGMLRRVLGPPVATTYWAAWGAPYLKPTDLWGVLPKMKFPEPKTWEKAPRGSRKGVQGVKGKGGKSSFSPRAPELRSKVPYLFSLALCEACELELGKKSGNSSAGVRPPNIIA